MPQPELVAVLLAAVVLGLAQPAAAAPVPFRAIYPSERPVDVTAGAASTIAVPDSGRITHTSILVRLHAGDVGAIGLKLVAPGGTAVQLLAAGGAAGTDIGSGASDCTGDLARFDVTTAVAGRDSAGPWTLQVTNATGTPATLSCWEVDVTHLAEVAEKGPVTAVLSYRHDPQPADGEQFRNVRLHIFGSGRLVYSGAFPHQWPAYGFTRSDSVQLRDLDGDGRPEVLLWLYSGGAHCCTSVRVFQVRGSTVRRSSWSFGDPGARLRRIGGRLLFVTADDRFAYAFTSYAASGLPVQVLRWRANRFVDVTRSHLGLVRADRNAWWRYTAGVLRQRDGDPRGLLAAWAADQCRLGRQAVVRAELAKLLRAGKLTHLPSEWPQGRAYVNALWKTLRRLGYTS